MEFTGERMIPEYNKEDIIYSEHLLRYSFCKQFVVGKKVIDVACGSGYGTRIIADAGAKIAHGADISPEAVEYATKTFAHPNSKYHVADGTDLPFNNLTYDVAVSFETIEHLENHHKFVDELKRVLTKDGLLIISSPNKLLYPSGNDFHYTEFTKDEFLDILQAKFKNVKLYYQNNFLLSSLFETSAAMADNILEIANSIKTDGLYFVALCSDADLPVAQTNSFVANPEEISTKAVVKEREKHIGILQHEIDELKGHIDYFKHNSVDKQQLHLFEIELEKYKAYHQSETEKLQIAQKALDQESRRFDEANRTVREKEERLEAAITSKADILAQLHIASENQIKLQDAYEQLKTRLAEESGKADYLYNLVQEQKNEVDSKAQIESEKARLQLVCDELTQKSNHIESLYREEQKKSDYLYALVKEKENENASFTDELNQSRTLITTLRETREDLYTKIEQINTERLALASSINQIVSENSRYKDEISRSQEIKLFLENRIIDLDKEKFELKLLLESKKNEVTRLESANTVLSQKQLEFAELGDRLVATKCELFDLQMAHIRLNEQLQQLNNQLNAQISRTIEIETSNAQYSELVATRDTTINDLEYRIQIFQHANEVNLQKIAELEQLAIDNHNEKSNLQRSLDELNLMLQKKTFRMPESISRIKQDFSFAIELLKREGLKSFIYRIFWYLRGKRLIEDIHEHKFQEINNKSSIKSNNQGWIRKAYSRVVSRMVFAVNEIKYAYQLLQREGIKSFIYRLFWYLRGKRLIEEIQYDKNKKYLTVTHKIVNNKKILEFEKTKNPTVSIIIPVYNQFDYTYNCLQSILDNSTGIDYEVIIGDDQSSDETVNILDYVKNITVVRHKENLRFLLNCNTAAKKAKGKYVLFLNNDTTVHPDWLKHLLETFETHPQTGCVGGKLIYSDGRMQEAGGIIWDDASGWNFGRLADPDMPEYNYVKETDYVSGACLMLPRNLWDEIGGFDTRFVPAYYEDTDICFEVRMRGYKVMYQPLAQVTHFEGISNGTDLGAGQKQYQVVNHKKFVDKWGEELRSFNFPNAHDVFLARDRSRLKKQILVIDHYVPHYDKDAGSRSTFSYLKLLVKMGFNVKFIGDNFFKHEPYTTALQQLGIEVLYGNYYQAHIKDWIRDNGKYFHYVFAHRMHIAPKYFIDIKEHSSAKIIYIGHDLQHVKSLKEYEITNNEEHLRNHKKFKEIETAIFNTVDIIYPFSTYEAPLIQSIVPNKVVRAMPVYFFGDNYKTMSKFADRKNILFVGGFGHPPNVDAVLWFTSTILPIIWRSAPEIRFIIVGSNPPQEIQSLANDKIIVTGFVTDEELVSHYNQCRVAVLPLRVGAGVKGKLLEALYYMLPTVTTPVATEGVPGIETCSFIAAEEESFAYGVLRLYNEEQVWTDFSNKGARLIRDYYSEENARQLLLKDLI